MTETTLTVVKGYLQIVVMTYGFCEDGRFPSSKLLG